MTKSIGIKVSLPNYDVRNADPKELMFSSEFPCLRIKKIGKQTYSIPASSTQEFTFTHDTAFPIFPMALNYENSRYSSVDNITFDTTNVYITIINATGSTINSHFYYFIGII